MNGKPNHPERIPVLQVNNIDFSYGQVQVLHDVGFEIYRGEVVALLGTNGAGKSSILRVIAGLGTPSRGVVRLNGKTITYVSPEQRAKLGIDILPGGKAVFPTMTVAENLEMGAYAYRKDRADRDRRIARVLDLFPALQHRLSDRADSLSGGQQQMLGLARSLMHDPEILLIDELSLGLAPIVLQELLERPRTTEGGRDDHGHRRAIRRRRSFHRQPCHLPREGRGQVRRTCGGVKRTG